MPNTQIMVEFTPAQVEGLRKYREVMSRYVDFIEGNGEEIDEHDYDFLRECEENITDTVSDALQTQVPE